MHESRTYTIFPSNLDILATVQATFDQFARFGYEEDRNSSCKEIRVDVHPTDDRWLSGSTCAALIEILAQYPHPHRMSAHLHWKNDSETISLDLSYSQRDLRIGLAGSLKTIAAFHDALRQTWKAESVTKERTSLVNRFSAKPTVFLARRFDKHGEDLAIYS